MPEISPPPPTATKTASRSAGSDVAAAAGVGEEGAALDRRAGGPGVDAHAVVLAAGDRLVGLVGLRSLLLAADRTPILDLVVETVPAVNVAMDREEVALAFDRYDHAMLPVVDDEERLLGVVPPALALGYSVTFDVQHRQGFESLYRT